MVHPHGQEVMLPIPEPSATYSYICFRISKKWEVAGPKPYRFTIVLATSPLVAFISGCTLCKCSSRTANASSGPWGVEKVKPQTQSAPNFSAIVLVGGAPDKTPAGAACPKSTWRAALVS